MKKLKAYFRSRAISIISILVVFMCFGALFYLGNQNINIYIVALECSTFIIVIFFIIDFLIFNGDEKVSAKLQNARREIIELKEKESKKNKALEDYFLVWIHQIKTPLTAAKLLSSDNKDIQQQILFIENYTDMALNFLKISNNEAIYPKEVSLNDIIKPIIKRYSILFIKNRISIDYNINDEMVITDFKYCKVLIEQIISNSTKYTTNGKINIYFNNQDNSLVIEDTGIGIEKSDMPKITKMGYSGVNGYMNDKSTGIGLYLATEISQKLNIKMKIESEVNVGTKISLYFPREVLSFD